MTASQITDIIGQLTLRRKSPCAQAVMPGTFRQSSASALPGQ
ncbi:hypothetical protein [Cutibacterium namnetense]|uniref:Uncharacterized protein n=1 Tax=[Propionibacterium] namnetense SK182B-JCVI TaxID=1051006 RepID=F9NTM2_9ACTN|nr:hypothetical protein [Cutibacterium namnetense]EGR97763.1 hypothetical protein HMPREF1162_0395 [ [[Propionibacterium] namnetense SK182B-JCVI]